MINVNQVLKPASQFLKINAPALLTAFGAVGVVTTAVLTGKATFEAAKKIAEVEAAQEGYAPPAPLTKTEKVKLVWPLYVGAVSSGVLSCGAIVMSHRISSRRAAMLAAAYALNEGKLEEYQDKIKEKFGIKKEKEARSELKQDQINRDFDNAEVLLNASDGMVLMREDYTGRFFYSNIELVNKAVNEINAHILKEGSARISDFYDLLKISHVSTSDYFGWTKEDPLEIEWDTCTTPDGTEAVHCFEYSTHPVQDPEREAGRSFR
jgi:hypothetical protein